MYQRLDDTDAVIALAARYFHAMVDADEEAIREIFDPRASIIGEWEGGLAFASVDKFVSGLGDAKTGDKPFEYRIENVTMVGDTAVVTVGNYCYGYWFTDHLSMMNVDGNWRIVAKTYYAHAS